MIADKFQKIESADLECTYDLSLTTLKSGDLVKYKLHSRILIEYGVSEEKWSWGIFMHSHWYAFNDIAPYTIGKDGSVQIIYELEIVELSSGNTTSISTADYEIYKLVKSE